MSSSGYTVRYASSFADDLERAVAYYREKSGDRAANRFIDDYERVVGLLESMPGYGSPIGDTGLRWAHIGVFDAVYHTEEGTRTVTLMRLFYCRADWKARLLGK